MISSRWPRPTFVIASIALIPVWSGSFTGWRSTTPGALNSSGRVSSVSIGPRPSSGLPRGSTTRPRSASPTGTLATRPERRTGSPSRMCSHSPKSAAPTSSSSRLKARPTTPCSSSSISRATQFSSPYARAMPSPTCRTVPTSARSVSTSYSSIRCFRIEVISSGRSFTKVPFSRSSGCQLATEPFQAAPNARIEPVGADLQDDAADQVGIDLAPRLDLPARGLLDLGEELARVLVGKLDRRRELCVDDPLVVGDQALELGGDLLEVARTALVCEDEQEVAQQLVGAGEQLLQRRRPGPRVDLRVAQELAQLGHLRLGRHHLRQLLPHSSEAILVA